jgi:hypothetical protein
VAVLVSVLKKVNVSTKAGDPARGAYRAMSQSNKEVLLVARATLGVVDSNLVACIQTEFSCLCMAILKTAN